MNKPHDPNRTVDEPSASSDSFDARQTREFEKPAAPLRTSDHVGASVSTDGSHPGADAPGGDLPLVPGYRVLREIARGGMGKVLAAFDLNLDREVALKILLPGANADRFVRESKITARLPHPGIPPVHALGTLADGSPFLAMKLIAGQTLAHEMKTADRPRLLQAFTQVCQAVGFAHSRGVIHRDLKPANVMVGAFGEVQVMDWGLAKDLTNREVVDQPRASGMQADPTIGNDANQTTDPSPGESTDDRTQAGTVMGTPAYMAPEQARGEAADARADVFALGGILCAILTGKPPFGGKSAREIIQRAAVADLAEAHARLDGCGADAELLALCRRCLSPNPADRPANAQAVADALTAYLNSVQERLQVAERERAVAVVREAEQRKKRKVQLALAGLSFLVVVGLVAGGFWYEAQLQEARERTKADTRAAELVKSLASSDTAAVPRIVEELANYRSLAEPALAAMLANARPESKERLHASLALLPGDPTQVPYLYDRLLDARPQEVPVIRETLAPHRDELLDKLWAVAESKQAGQARARLRAAAALALYDPESEKWAAVQTAVADDLVGEPAVYLSNWLEALRPVRVKLLAPLSVVFADSKRRETQRSLASDILNDYALDQGPVLANLVMNSDPQQFAVFFPKLKDRGEEGLPALIAEIDKKLPAAVPSSHPDREKLGKRQANAAAALLKMNHPAKAWQVFQHGADPRARSYLIHWLSPLGVSARAIAQRLDAEPDESIRRALLLSLGEFKETEFSLEERKVMLPKLQDLYRTADDPGIHAACEWLLRTWKQEAWLKQMNDGWAKDQEQRQKRLGSIEQRVKKEQEKTPPEWYVNGQGQTMVVIPGPVEFVMGSPMTEADRQDYELQHRRRIGRTFALAAAPVTKEQFLRYQPKFGHNQMMRYPESTCPIGGVIWYEAAAYCNWLSEQEGMPESEWCYEPVQDARELAVLAASTVGLLGGRLGSLTATSGVIPGRGWPRYVEGMKLARNYLQRQGYRLPTEAEMEYATRAGAMTSRYFGETEELLAKYAWYEKNAEKRTWPVGSLKPNDLGLFDVQGNVYTWCQESSRDYKEYLTEKKDEIAEDGEDGLVIESTRGRVLRGGSFSNVASFVRSADRNRYVPAARSGIVAFRPARTFR